MVPSLSFTPLKVIVCTYDLHLMGLMRYNARLNHLKNVSVDTERRIYTNHDDGLRKPFGYILLVKVLHCHPKCNGREKNKVSNDTG